jgi:uncharacterized OsmC-like protein
MSVIRNGVNVDALTATVNAIKLDSTKARFEFHARTEWQGGARSRIKIRGFTLECDEPPVLLGSNTAANPVEMVLAALGSCLAVGFAYSAAIQDINLESMELEVKGNLDLQGFLGISKEVRPGYQNVQVICRLKSDAPVEKIKELFEHVIDTSPVTDIIRNPVPVTISLEEIR